MKKVNGLILIGLCILIIGCNPFKKAEYDLFVYPKKSDLTTHIFAGTFASLEEARDVADEYMQKYPEGDYEIGKNKIKTTSGGLNVYEETLR